jgi:hypothetical protein
MAAAFFALGKLVTVAAGTPVQVPPPALPGAGPASPALSTVHAFVVEALESNTGKVYIGIAGMDKTTRVGVLMTLPVPTANLIPTFSVSLTAAANALSLTDIWIDTDNNGEGVTISGIVA